MCSQGCQRCSNPCCALENHKSLHLCVEHNKEGYDEVVPPPPEPHDEGRGFKSGAKGKGKFKTKSNKCTYRCSKIDWIDDQAELCKDKCDLFVDHALTSSHICQRHRDAPITPVMFDTGACENASPEENVLRCNKKCSCLYPDPVESNGALQYINACPNKCAKEYHEDSLTCICQQHLAINPMWDGTLASIEPFKNGWLTARAGQIIALRERYDETQGKLKNLTIIKLRTMCKAFRHPVSGIKDELIKRVSKSIEHKDFDKVLESLSQPPGE